jgi:hypothetical protein
MPRWTQVGYIGLGDEDATPFMGDYGAVQQYSATQQEFGEVGDIGQARRGAAPRRAFVARPPPEAPPRVPLPSGLAARLGQVPVEVFDIFPAYPNVTVSTALSMGTAQVETTVHTFNPPTGHYVVINPSDLTQEVLLETFNSLGTASTNYIKGLVNIYTRTGLQGFQQRLYSGGSEFHNPNQQMASMGNRRRWQFGAIISPGDNMETRFFGAAATDIFHSTNSHLDHRVSVKKITP